MCEILNVHVQKVDKGMGSMSTLRSGPRSPRSPGPRAPSRASFICSGSLDFTGFPLFLCLHEIVDSWFYNECG